MIVREAGHHQRAAALLGLCALAMSATGCLAHHKGAMPGEPARASFAELRGARVHYVDQGKAEGSPVVLIHGFASSLGVWAGLRPVLEREHRVVALDLKGFGWTDRPRGDYSPQEQARIVVALLDQLKIKQAAVVAHSWGSSVALALVLLYPERVSKIVLYDAWVYAEQLPTFFLWSRAAALGELLFGLFYKEQPDVKMSNAFYDKAYITEPFVEHVQKQLDRPGTTAAALAAVRGQRYELVQDRYREIKQPTLLLWGREDAVTVLDVGERLSTTLPNARLVVYPRCGHFPMIEAAAASNAEVARFLRDDAQGER